MTRVTSNDVESLKSFWNVSRTTGSRKRSVCNTKVKGSVFLVTEVHGFSQKLGNTPGSGKQEPSTAEGMGAV